ncbi:MAG: osmoprotectant NAGGN system M42 family peptidase [Acidimicrobiia bacterium]|nr:osmoprotectant NAGGN system M42 family peptidase [Acidimicrobiia bacterium]
MSTTGTRTIPPVDTDELLDVLITLLRTPSPSGRTDQAIQLVGDYVSSLGLACEVTRRGALRIEVPGTQDTIERAVIAHVDTLGAMVTQLKDNGRLAVAPIGTHSARFVEGARCTIFTDEHSEVPITGTVLPLKASGHRYNKEVDEQPSAWSNLEIRVDERVRDARDLAALGIQVGDHVGLDAVPVITPAGFVNSRHLDDKAGVAAVLAALRAITALDEPVSVGAHVLITITEEVGHGASHGIEEDVAELVAVDNAVVAPGQTSTEEAVTIAMQDMHGPFDYHLTRMLISLCKEHGIPHHRDVFAYYRSDAAAALEAGLATRAALVTFGLDASHGWERTHVDSLGHLATLLALYLRSDLTFRSWDRTPWGPLADFPSTSVQPSPTQGPR